MSEIKPIDPRVYVIACHHCEVPMMWHKGFGDRPWCSKCGKKFGDERAEEEAINLSELVRETFARRREHETRRSQASALPSADPGGHP